MFAGTLCSKLTKEVASRPICDNLFRIAENDIWTVGNSETE